MKVDLKEIMNQVRGVTYKKSDATILNEPGKLPVLRAGNIKDGLIVKEDYVYIPESKISPKQRLRYGDVLIAASSGSLSVVGKAAMIEDENIEASFGAFCKVLRPKLYKINDRYFKYFFETSYYKNTIKHLAEGANINNLKTDHFNDLKIPLPPLPVQQKIAAILDAADEYRQKTKALIEKYDELAQSIFLEMFGDPIANPKKWKVQKLGNIATKIQSGNTPKGGSNVYVNQGIIFFRSQNIWRNNIVYEEVAYIDEITNSKMSNTSLKNGDILLTKTGRINTENSSLGRAALFNGEDDSANINGHVYLIRLKKDVLNEFVLYNLTSNEYREYIRRVCVGGIDKRQINKEHLEEFPIISPPTELQEKYVTILKLINNQKVYITSELNKSEELFQSLLQRAFKGELE